VNRLDGPLDGLLHLMDRQVVDDEGLMVCKCDDLELTDRGDGGLMVTALLIGVPVWLPRLHRWVYDGWRRLGDSRIDRQQPYRIDLADVERVTQEIRLRRGRAGALERQRPGDTSVRRLVGDLLGAQVLGPGEEHLGKVLDVRLEPTREPNDHALVLSGLLVGRGRPGSYLGYDRSEEHGPWIVGTIVRRLHRHSGMVAVSHISELDWDRHRVTVRTGLGPLTHSGASGDAQC